MKLLTEGVIIDRNVRDTTTVMPWFEDKGHVNQSKKQGIYDGHEG